MRTGSTFTLSAQNMAYENGSWWLPEVEVEGRAKEICPTCGNYYYVDEPWDHVCTQECEYCYLTIASDQYEAHVQKEHSTYCLYCGQYFVGDHTCKEKDNSSGGNGGTSGNGGNSNNGTTNNSQEAYNYPYDDWNKLTPQEQEFVKKHPLAAIDFRNNATKALQEAYNYCLANGIDTESLYNGIGDCYRHMLWSAYNCFDQGYELSKEYGLAHESSPSNPIEEKEMDLYNNEIGFEIGQTAKQNGHSKESIQSLVAAAINQGRGKVIK